MKKTVAFYTLGCRLNIFETDGIAHGLQKNGYVRIATNSSIQPDVIVVNTCTVTNRADSKNRNIIRSAIKKNPGSEVWVTGCYAETDKTAIASIPGVTGVVGNDEKASLPDLISRKQVGSIDRFSYSDVLPSGHTRAYLKIQDGCDRSCSYCKIPLARGKGVSRKYKDIIDQVRFLQDQGIGEIVLTGVNLGWYRNEKGKKSFNHLLESILNELEYSRLRISSIEPSEVNNGLVELLNHPRFCSYLHIPLQSGSSEILKKMKRSYRKETFIQRVELVQKKNDRIFLGTDVITGFPGETEQQFTESMELLEKLGFARIHAFPYSKRQGTLAAELVDNTSREQKKNRVHQLNQYSQRAYFQYSKQFINQTCEAIVEGDGNFLTDNYLKITPESHQVLTKLKTGQFVNIQIQSCHLDEERQTTIIKGRIKVA